MCLCVCVCLRERERERERETERESCSRDSLSPIIGSTGKHYLQMQEAIFTDPSPRAREQGAMPNLEGNNVFLTKNLP